MLLPLSWPSVPIAWPSMISTWSRGLLSVLLEITCPLDLCKLLADWFSDRYNPQNPSKSNNPRYYQIPIPTSANKVYVFLAIYVPLFVCWIVQLHHERHQRQTDVSTDVCEYWYIVLQERNDLSFLSKEERTQDCEELISLDCEYSAIWNCNTCGIARFVVEDRCVSKSMTFL